MPRKSKTPFRRCQCDTCSKDSPQGLLIPAHTFVIHSRQQRIRNALGSAEATMNMSEDAPAVGSAEATINPDSSLADMADDEDDAPGAETAKDFRQHRSTSSDADYLLSIEADIEAQMSTLYSEFTLEFLHDPSPDTPFRYPDPTTLGLFNSGYFSLKTNKACNRRFLEIESHICGLWQQMEKLPPEGRSERLEDSLHHALTTIHRLKSKHWTDQAYPNGPLGRSFNNLRHFRGWAQLCNQSELTANCTAVLIIYIKFQTPVRKMRIILALQRWIMEKRTSSSWAHVGSNPIASQIPKNINTIVDHYSINPTTRTFICCSQCFAILPLTNDNVAAARSAYIAQQPLPSCKVQSAPDSLPCGNPLWKIRRIDDKSFVVLIQKQVFQDFKDWLGKLLATPGVEEEFLNNPPLESNVTKDFRDSPIVRAFKGSDGLPYIREPSGTPPDLRLMMSLGTDGFHPFSNSRRAATVSCTAIYMVLLSLPKHLRYQQKYLYLVTVLSGSVHSNINHSLAWLVDQILPFWEEGVYYTRTAKYILGRRTFVVIIPIVCDTEAATEISGFASHSHHNFCRRCLLQLKDIDNLDPDTWPLRDAQTHREIALEWKNSPEPGRKALFDKHGVRYTELLRLPYMDLILFTIFDVMHFGDLGNLRTHIMDIFQVDHTKLGGEGLGTSTKDNYTKPSNSTMRTIWNVIRENRNLDPQLRRLNFDVLRYICFALGLRTNTRRNASTLVKRIVEWRADVNEDQIPTIPRLNYANVVPEDDEESGNGTDVSVNSATSFNTANSFIFTMEVPPPPPVTRPFNAPALASRDSEYNDLKAQVKNFSGHSPGYKVTSKVLQTLCQDLGIPFAQSDTKIIIINRIRSWRKDHGTPDRLNNPEDAIDSVQYEVCKRKFEAKELAKSTLVGFTVDILRRLCQEYQIPLNSYSHQRASITADEMARRLKLWRQEHRDSMVTPLESPRAVIGKNVLGEVDIDRKRTLLPSWTSTVWDNWGTPSGGTLGADEWRTLCFIHLVVTLIRIWGYEYEETSRHFQMLLNYLDLVHALHVLYLHETSSPLQEYYCSRMLRYLHTVITLFPDIQLKPNHHYAIHAAEDLKLMGPPHARSTPVFECVNLKLRETNTNKHLGSDVEETMLNSFCCQGNLDLMLEHDMQDLKQVVNTMDAIKREDCCGMFAGTDLSIWSSTEFSSTPIQLSEQDLDRIVDLLCQVYNVDHSHWSSKVFRNAFDLGGVAVGRAIYSPKLLDSSVVFTDEGCICAGTILQVISYPYRNPHRNPNQDSANAIYLRIRPMEPINPQSDLYRKLNCGWLCDCNPLMRDKIIPMVNLISHFARTDFPIRGQLVTHVLPLVKVFHGNPSGRPNPGTGPMED